MRQIPRLIQVFGHGLVNQAASECVLAGFFVALDGEAEKAERGKLEPPVLLIFNEL